LVVADFGISRFHESELHTAVNTKAAAKLANFGYAAPEQKAVGGDVDHRADIFSLGLILNELFTSVVPYGTGYKTISSVSGQHAYLDDFVNKCIHQDPGSRFQSVEEMKQELLARGNEFIQVQKLDALRKTVIPDNEISDSIVHEPVRIIGFEWDKGLLELALNHEINPIWNWAFDNMGNHTSVFGKGPSQWGLHGNVASVYVVDSQVQKVIDYFKEWLPLVHRAYVRKLEENISNEKREIKQEMANKLAAESRRLEVMKNVKI